MFKRFFFCAPRELTVVAWQIEFFFSLTSFWYSIYPTTAARKRIYV
jgi:hypothetical protein